MCREKVKRGFMGRVFMSIKGRLLVVFLAISFFAVGIVSFVAISQSEKALIDATWKEGESIIQALGDNTNAYFKECLFALTTGADRAVVKTMDWEKQEPFLIPLKEFYQFDDLYVMWPDGTTRLVGNSKEYNWGDRGYFKQTMNGKKASVTDPFIFRATNKLVTVVTAPIIDAGKVVGVLAATVTTNALNDMAASVKWGEKGYAALIDSKGIIVAHPKRDMVGKLNVAQESHDVPAAFAQAVREGLRGNKGHGEYAFQGKDTMILYVPIPLTDWCAMLVAPKGQFLAPVRSLEKTILMVIAVLAVVIVAISLLFANSIARPIRDVTVLLERRGDLYLGATGVEDRLFKCSITEIAQMVRALRKMGDALRGIVSSISDTAFSLGEKAEDFSAVAEEANAGIEEARAGTETMTQTMESIAAAGEELNASVEEVAAGAGTVATRSGDVSEQVEGARTAGEVSREASIQVIRGMEIQTAQMEESAQATVELANKATQIQKIVITITGIADQTNLLALNAAIEAARAGEAGRGFAVVAEEVRKLAEESNDAAHGIADLAESISKDLERVKEGAEHNREGVQEVNTNVKGVSEKIDLIMEALEKIAESSQDVAAVSQEQAASSEEIAEVVQGTAGRIGESTQTADALLNQIKDMATMVQHVAQGGEELARISGELRSHIGKFSTDEA